MAEQRYVINRVDEDLFDTKNHTSCGLTILEYQLISELYARDYRGADFLYHALYSPVHFVGEKEKNLIKTHITNINRKCPNVIVNKYGKGWRLNIEPRKSWLYKIKEIINIIKS